MQAFQYHGGNIFQIQYLPEAIRKFEDAVKRCSESFEILEEEIKLDELLKDCYCQLTRAEIEEIKISLLPPSPESNPIFKDLPRSQAQAQVVQTQNSVVTHLPVSSNLKKRKSETKNPTRKKEPQNFGEQQRIMSPITELPPKSQANCDSNNSDLPDFFCFSPRMELYPPLNNSK